MTTLIQIPVLSDNYTYLIVDDDKKALVIDTAEAEPVLDKLNEMGAKLVAVLNTHWHADHVGGNEKLVAKTGCRVFGPEAEKDRIPCITDLMQEGGIVSINQFSFRVLEVHAHTAGHIAYFSETGADLVVQHGHAGVATKAPHLANRPILFCGDTLFAAGCGRLFEGTPADMVRALSKIAALNPKTIACCAHEYTLGNLKFAHQTLPKNEAIKARLAQFEANFGNAKSSVPPTLAEELATNPFLLALDDAQRPEIIEEMGLSTNDAVSALAALRAAKDVF